MRGMGEGEGIGNNTCIRIVYNYIRKHSLATSTKSMYRLKVSSGSPRYLLKYPFTALARVLVSHSYSSRRLMESNFPLSTQSLTNLVALERTPGFL